MAELPYFSVETDVKHWVSIVRDAEMDSYGEKFRKEQPGMEDVEELKAQVKKLNAQATTLKMDLHDLAEDLPTGWEKILEVANKAHQAYQSLDEARKRLAASAG